MYQELITKNKDFFKSIKAYRKYESYLTNLTESLNMSSIVTVSGLRHTGRTALVHTMIEKTQKMNETFYYNAELDTSHGIKNKDDFIILFDLYVRIYSVPKIIVLQNMNNIEGIKDLIMQLYKTKKYKIILIGNNIQIQGVNNIELFPLNITTNIDKNIYGGLPAVRMVPDNSYKDFLLTTMRNDILLTDIISSYNVKNVTLYSYVLGFLSDTTTYHSIREIHRNLKNQEIDISHLTLIDYLTSATNTKILSKCFRYDMKTQSEISSQVLYYFGDVGIRKTFSQTVTHSNQNLLYINFLAKGYSVNGGINGKFLFDFYARKGDSLLCIQFETATDKSEIRKTARKLAKIDSPAEKFVIVDSKENIEGMRKFEEQGVRIVELLEIIKYL